MVTFIPRQNQLLVPPLESGDRLSRSEFERRYAAMPKDYKAQLIDGIVYMAAALRFEPHAEPHADLITWLGIYKMMTPGVRLGDTPTVRLDPTNEPQPDVVLRLDETVGGQSVLGPEGYVEGAPEFVAEIAASTASIDTGPKRQIYCRTGVQEYLVWPVFDQKILWYRLKNKSYIELPRDEKGIIRSEAFSGLWLDEQALLRGDMQQVMAVLQQGLASPEHQELVARLGQ